MSEDACGQGRGADLVSALSVLTAATGVAGAGTVSTTGGATVSGGLCERTERIVAVTARKRTRINGIAFCMAGGWLTTSGFGNAENHGIKG